MTQAINQKTTSLKQMEVRQGPVKRKALSQAFIFFGITHLFGKYEVIENKELIIPIA